MVLAFYMRLRYRRSESHANRVFIDCSRQMSSKVLVNGHRFASFRLILCLVALLPTLVLAPLPAQAKEASKPSLLVAAAASLTDAVQSLKPLIEHRLGVTVRFDLAGTPTLVRQIENGAPIDVLLAADEASMDDLQTRKLIAPQTRHDVARNTLVLVVPAGAPAGLIKAPADLDKPAVHRFALCNAAVPAGHYARQLLTHLGLLKTLHNKIVESDNVRAALAQVVSGAVQAGFVYATDAAAAHHQVRVVYTADAAQSIDVRYPAAALRASKHPKQAAQLVELLTSLEAQKKLTALGFKAIR